MENTNKQASKAASLLAKRKHEIQRETMTPEEISKMMSEIGKRPRPNRRKKAAIQTEE